MIEFENVSKSYGAVRALEPMSLEFPEGETTVLIGPSGCGKSTILRLIVGLIRPDTGLIRVEREVLRPKNVVHLRRRMGYVIQEGGLFPHLTARENVVLMARRMGWNAQRIVNRVEELSDLVDIPLERLQSYPSQLSGGQRQRISLMRALMLDPDVLLLDEPLGALDPMIRAGLQDELKQIFATLGKTVVLVTHNIGEAAHFAERIVLLRSGRVVQEGTLHHLLHEPADPFVDEFVRAQRSPLDSLDRA
ncbi:MAG: ATP-binding cassette domain-containing protein [Rhodothermales bacterium]